MEVIALLFGFVDIGVFIDGLFGVFREDDHGFTFEHFAVFATSHNLEVFVGIVIILFELERIDLNLEPRPLHAKIAELLLELPVTRCGGNRTVNATGGKNESHGSSDIREGKNILLRVVAEASKLRLDPLHMSYYTAYG